jgi:hypothetical protein
MFFIRTQDFSLGHIFPRSESVLDKLEDGFFLRFVKLERAVGDSLLFSCFRTDFRHAVGRNAKYPRENLIAQSNAAIGTNKIKKKQDLFVSRIQVVPLGCRQDGTDILARQSGLLKCMLSEF